MLPQEGGKHIPKESQQGGHGRKRTETPGKCFRTKAVKFAILTFTKNLSNLIIHFQMDKKVAL